MLAEFSKLKLDQEDYIMQNSLERSFYERNTLQVARELLGKYLIHELNKETTVGKIVEVEAYIGPTDAAAHTFRG